MGKYECPRSRRCNVGNPVSSYPSQISLPDLSKELSSRRLRRSHNDAMSRGLKRKRSPERISGLDSSEIDTMEKFASISGLYSNKRVRPVQIDDLPTEMLWKVFSYLDLKELVSACRVSYRWKDVGNGVPLMKKLKYIIQSDEETSKIVGKFQSIPQLRNVKICHSPKRNVESILIPLLKVCTDIRDMDIDVSVEIDSNLLQDVVKKFTKLESLSVPLCSHAPHVIYQISACLELQQLVISHCDFDIDLKPIAEGCPNLVHLDISRCTYKYDDFNYLLRRKKHLLETLWFNLMRYPKETAPPLGECTRLEEIGCVYILSKTLTLFLDEIVSLPGLKTLYVRLCENISREDAMKLSKRSFSSTLTTLIIMCYYGVTQDFSRTIVSYLPNVERLGVVIGEPDRDMEALRNLLEMKKLKRLAIKMWPLWGPLLDTLLKCKQIKHLVIVNCFGLNDAAALRLVEEMELSYLKINQCLSLTDGFLKSFPRCDTLKELHVEIKDPLEETVRELKLRQPSTTISVRNISHL